MEKVICRFCKKEIDKSSAYNPKPRIYFCNEEHSKLQNNKDKYKPKKVKSNGQTNDRRILTDTIQEIYLEQGYDKHFIPWSIETARIKNILDEHNDWVITGLIYTLNYMKEIEQINFFNEQANCVMALVPFYYLKAMKYYNEMVDIESSLNEFEIKTFKTKPINNIKKKYKEIRMEDI